MGFLQDVAEKIITCSEVVSEITNKRQLRRLVVLPYDLIVKEAFPENVKIITEFAKKTGDYPSLSATDIKVMALTYQLEKEKVGIDHLRSEPIMQKAIVSTKKMKSNMSADVTGFYKPGKSKLTEFEHITGDGKQENEKVVKQNVDDEIFKKSEETDDNKGGINSHGNDKMDVDSDEDEKSIGEEDFNEEELAKELDSLRMQSSENLQNIEGGDSIFVAVKENNEEGTDNVEIDNEDADDGVGWITPSNIQIAKKQFNSALMESKKVTVSCMTTDFAMQNVLKQLNLNVSALDGRLIKQVRTFILRCYTCFKTTSIMTKKFCPKCGNNTLKKVAVSLDKNGKMKIHINPKHPLTSRGKKFSLPRIRGGKHPVNPVLVEDQPMADNKPSRLARTKNNPLEDDYVAGQ